MALKYIDIVDPTFPKNNLGKSISRINAYRFQEALALQGDRLDKLYSKNLGPSEHFTALLKMFGSCFEVANIYPPLTCRLPAFEAVEI